MRQQHQRQSAARHCSRFYRMVKMNKSEWKRSIAAACSSSNATTASSSATPSISSPNAFFYRWKLLGTHLGKRSSPGALKRLTDDVSLELLLSPLGNIFPSPRPRQPELVDKPGDHVCRGEKPRIQVKADTFPGTHTWKNIRRESAAVWRRGQQTSLLLSTCQKPNAKRY